MSRAERLSFSFSFVDFIPEVLEERHLYISVEFATAAHKCACGCGKEVVTPLSPTDWALTFDGETASLRPSIGNWGFECRSHYWITRNRIVWAPAWPEERVHEGKLRDRLAKQVYFGESDAPVDNGTDESLAAAPVNPVRRLWLSLKRWAKTLKA